MKIKDNSLCYQNNYKQESVSQSLFEILEQVKTQVSYASFSKEYFSKLADRSVIKTDPLVDEICMIISEALIFNPSQAMRINKTMIPVQIVQEVYRELTRSNIEMVLENFKKISIRIHNKKSYLQTALYNSVFELNAHYTNLANHDRENYL